MRNSDGTPRVCDNVWISYLTGWDTFGEGSGKLTAGYGAREDDPTKDGGMIDPEFTFGIYTEKLLNQPILIIKTAWGGKSLNTDFRPPNAGPYPFGEQQLAEFKKKVWTSRRSRQTRRRKTTAVTG
jgi:alpha-galactosidase